MNEVGHAAALDRSARDLVELLAERGLSLALAESLTDVVTAEAAAEMARGAQRLFGADCGLGLTGVAGPAEQNGHPVGVAHVAAVFGGALRTASGRFPGEPDEVRRHVAERAFSLLAVLVDPRGG
ncbi:MAG: CinA family protein [Acidimicrobiales bacterium]